MDAGLLYRQRPEMNFEFLLEERSMRCFLETLLPRILPSHLSLGHNVCLRPHSGKQDLYKSIPNKLAAAKNANKPTAFVVIHDQDSNDCLELKQRILALFSNYNYPHLVRMPCRELENWYLGSPETLDLYFQTTRFTSLSRKKQLREPDKHTGSKFIESKTDRPLAKTEIATFMGANIALDNTRSKSF